MVIINLDKERKFNFNLNAMSNYEEVTGNSFFSIDTEKLGAKDLRAILWAGLNEEEEIDIKTVGKLLTVENMELAGKAIEEEFKKIMPKGTSGGK